MFHNINIDFQSITEMPVVQYGSTELRADLSASQSAQRNVADNLWPLWSNVYQPKTSLQSLVEISRPVPFASVYGLFVSIWIGQRVAGSLQIFAELRPNGRQNTIDTTLYIQRMGASHLHYTIDP